MRYAIGAVFLALALVSLSPGQQNNQANPCELKEQHQLDFWVGEWDLTWPGDKPNEIEHTASS